MEKPFQEIKGQLPRSVPQIFESGLSGDYINEYANWMGYDLASPDQSKKWTDWFMEDAAGYVKRGYVLRTYEQRFPVSKYGSALTVENEAKVVLLDKIAGELQHRFDEEMVPLLALYKAGTLTDDDRARVFDFIRYGVSVMNRASQIIHKDSAHQKMKR